MDVAEQADRAADAQGALQNPGEAAHDRRQEALLLLAGAAEDDREGAEGVDGISDPDAAADAADAADQLTLF